LLQPILRPTQNSVGYAWAERKQLTTPEDAQSEMDESILPVVLGPGPALYLLDGHHTCSALDFSGFYDTLCSIYVVCDWRNDSLAVFWQRMQDENYAYLLGRPSGDPNQLPVPINYTTLPQIVAFRANGSSFADDVWRSWSGFLRKIQKWDVFPPCDKAEGSNCMRGYDRICDPSDNAIPFFEYRWAYYLNQACTLNLEFWGTSEEELRARELFLDQSAHLPWPQLPGQADVSSWIDITLNLFYLVRGAEAGNYTLPSGLPFFGGNKLPGDMLGYAPFPAGDPDCNRDYTSSCGADEGVSQ